MIYQARFHQSNDFFTKILDLAIKYCSLSDEQRFIIIRHI